VSLLCAFLLAVPQANAQSVLGAPFTNTVELGKQLQVGDVVFIRIPHAPFTKVSDTTLSWTNHVGIVMDVSGSEPVIAESHVPFSGKTGWTKFAQRSEQGRVAVTRLAINLDPSQRERLVRAATARFGVRYDTGFDLHSRGQFCSRFVREVLHEATGIEIGQVETFSKLLDRKSVV
jgi:hypothetical protein